MAISKNQMIDDLVNWLASVHNYCDLSNLYLLYLVSQLLKYTCLNNKSRNEMHI